MESIIKITTCIFLTGIMFLVSCKKETSCEGCKENNKPPIAVAGPDQVITLPADSISLDGNSSSDPDGTISEWLWTKISGPVSFNIIRQSDSISKVKALVMGTYQFELKVTDNSGLSAKDTVQVIVNDPLIPNRPPFANAGADQTITLPTNTVTLNGNGSADPDNNITSYLWTKISGPSSFNIVNTNIVQTQVTNLSQGAYLFELKVTDARGLFSKDTMQVIINPQPPPQFACDNSNRPQIAAQLIPIGTLSRPNVGMAVASAGNKILFAGGHGSSGSGSSRVDIYDTATQTWSMAELSEARWGIAAVGAGNKIFFAGGEYGDGAFDTYYSTVDIYDISSNTWSVASLSEPRSLIAAAAVGNKVFFAGGEFDDNQASNKVDIYDLSTNTWSTVLLNEPREMISAVTVDDKIYFAGGGNNDAGLGNDEVSSRIDIYDNLTNSWSISSLNGSKAVFAAIAVDSKIYWAGGFTGALLSGTEASTSCAVEIKDVNTGNSVIDYLFKPGIWRVDDGNNAVIKDNKIVFLRTPLNTNANNKFDIYDVTTNAWSIGVLPVSIWGASIISVNNTIYVAGGLDGGSYNPSKQVWKLAF